MWMAGVEKNESLEGLHLIFRRSLVTLKGFGGGGGLCIQPNDKG